MSHTKDNKRFLFLRWSLEPLAAALWQNVSKEIAQSLDAQSAWVEIEPSENLSSTLRPNEQIRLLESIGENRPVAFVMGVDRTSFLSTVSKARIIRECCDHLALMDSPMTERARTKAFSVAWFPDADRSSKFILRELGFDLVLHDPASLRAVITKMCLSYKSS